MWCTVWGDSATLFDLPCKTHVYCEAGLTSETLTAGWGRMIKIPRGPVRAESCVQSDQDAAQPVTLQPGPSDWWPGPGVAWPAPSSPRWCLQSWCNTRPGPASADQISPAAGHTQTSWFQQSMFLAACFAHISRDPMIILAPSTCKSDRERKGAAV